MTSIIFVLKTGNSLQTAFGAGRVPVPQQRFLTQSRPFLDQPFHARRQSSILSLFRPRCEFAPETLDIAHENAVDHDR
jgi:hypothetical protein